MSMYAAQFDRETRYWAAETNEPPKRKRWFDIELIELVRPHGYWPQPLSIEQAFELFRWMVGTAKGYDATYGTPGVLDLLSATSGVGHYSVIPVKSLEDLRERFHYAILGQVQSVAQANWRIKYGIDHNGKLRIPTRVYRPFEGAPHLGLRAEQDIRDLLDEMMVKSIGTEMAVSLNSVHPGCKTVHGMRIEVSPDAFHIGLVYGEEKVQGGSNWSRTLARTRDGETFVDTLDRARNLFDCLVKGKMSEVDLSDFAEHHSYGVSEVVAQIEKLGGKVIGLEPTETEIEDETPSPGM